MRLFPYRAARTRGPVPPAAPDPQPAAPHDVGAVPVNGYDILAKVAALPISTWRYRTEPAHVRHLGPMAQDWKAAFGLGDSDTVIPVVDAQGVALVSIQALHRLLNEMRADLDRLRAQVDDLTTRII